jgi:hypothetical protein
MPEVDEVDVQLDMKEIDVKFARWVQHLTFRVQAWKGVLTGATR